MLEDDPFVSALSDNPRDNTVGLVYADWLEERGDPRAEYVRLQYQTVAAIRRLAELRTQLAGEWLQRVDLFRHVHVYLRSPLPGDTTQKVQVREVLVRPGERVSAGRPAFVIETDKEVMEVVPEVDCVVIAVLVEVGQMVVPAADVLALLMKV